MNTIDTHSLTCFYRKPSKAKKKWADWPGKHMKQQYTILEMFVKRTWTFTYFHTVDLHAYKYEKANKRFRVHLLGGGGVN